MLEEDGTGSISLMLTEFDPTAEAFEQAGYEGGGYGWHRVKDRGAIEKLARLLLEAIRDPDLLRVALAEANPDLLLTAGRPTPHHFELG